jgi:site-specific DNA recombinase
MSGRNGRRRAVGIIRVSRVGGREGERFVSPDEQRQRIESACARDGLELRAIHEELDVSGGKALADRQGLSAAVAAVEAGEAEVIAAAYFDRLFRSLSTQAEVLERVESAGGSVLAVDVGQVTNGSAGQWLSGTMLGAVAEYHRRSIRERSAEGQIRAVARGATPWARIQLGYNRTNGTLSPNPEEIPIVRRAFEMRDEGATIPEIRGMLKAHGVDRSHRGVQVMLASRVYLGEIHFGKLVNLNAHEPIIDRELWGRVQRRKVPRGPKPKSERLLARLGVLRCGSCDSRLSSAVMPQGGGYPIYRCGSTNDCSRHMVIKAELVEDKVVAWVKHHLAGLTGTASGAAGVSEAHAALERTQAALDAALRSFADAGLIGEPVAVETLDKLREARERAKERYDEAVEANESLSIAVTVGDWDELSLEGRRDLIKATIHRVVIHPGRGVDRIHIEPR